MEFILNLYKQKWFMNIIVSIIIILVSIILYKIIIEVLLKNVENDRFKALSGKKSKTYIKLIKSISRYVFIVCTVLLLLQVNGINVSSIIAGVGVLGIIFGLAIQDWLKDIIRGTDILSDNYFAVGDIVKYKNIEGKVLVLGLKSTKIQDLKTSNVITIANRNMDEIEIVSNFIYIKVPMPYEVKVEKAEKVMNEIIEKIKEYPNIKECRYKGVTELADSSILYLLEVEGSPIYKLQNRRDVLRTVLIVLDKNNISVPYNQLDIHNK